MYGVFSWYDFMERLQQLRIGRTGQVYVASAAGDMYLLPSQWGPDVSAETLRGFFTGESGFIKKEKPMWGLMRP